MRFELTILVVGYECLRARIRGLLGSLRGWLVVSGVTGAGLSLPGDGLHDAARGRLPMEPKVQV